MLKQKFIFLRHFPLKTREFQLLQSISNATMSRIFRMSAGKFDWEEEKLSGRETTNRGECESLVCL